MLYAYLLGVSKVANRPIYEDCFSSDFEGEKLFNKLWRSLLAFKDGQSEFFQFCLGAA